jgi:hypothetical protein
MNYRAGQGASLFTRPLFQWSEVVDERGRSPSPAVSLIECKVFAKNGMPMPRDGETSLEESVEWPHESEENITAGGMQVLSKIS